MKADETKSAIASSTESSTKSSGDGQSHRPSFTKVLDGRKQPIRGLWVRNGRFYAQLKIEDAATGIKKTRRVPLVDKDNKPVETTAQAVAILKRLQTQRSDNALPVLKRTPKFTDYVKEYLDYYDQVKDAKRPKTMQTEKGHLTQWKAHLGETRLDKITKPMITGFIAKRQVEGVSGRTVNLAVTVLRNVLKRAIDDGWLQRLPTENLRPLKWTARKKELVPLEQINKLCEAALEVSKNGVEFCDYIKLMAFCGSRMSETLRLKWSDVDFGQRQITIGSDGLAKNHKARVVDFNPKLEAHLKEMHKRKAKISDWLFPSPQRGNADKASKTYRETLLLARKAAGLDGFGFHDCRHHFVSMCVMSGIDFMTVATWAGHQDGGVLIGKVYGHLSGGHRQLMASKLNFEPVIVEKKENVA